MQSVESNARYLASTVAKQLFEEKYVDDEVLTDIPIAIVSNIVGRPIKKPKNADINKQLECAIKALSLVKKHDSLSSVLSHNISLLTEALSLPDYCKPVLTLCVITTLNHGLYSLLEEYIQHMMDDSELLMAQTIGLSIEELEQAIRLITQTTLFEQGTNSIFGLLIMSHSLASNLLSSKAKSYGELLNGMFHKMERSELTIKDYPHIELGYISEYLKHAIKHKTVGVNILLYGEAGTGKTELSKVLSQYVKSDLIAIKAAGKNLYRTADEISSDKNVAHLRLQHYQLMQSLFKSSKFSCMLLDEMEDIFTEYMDGIKVSKLKIHDILSSNTTICFWITNHIDMLPDSVIRRFSYVLQVPTPTKAIKADVLSKPLKGLRLSNDYKNRLASIPDLTPAHVANASNVAKALHLTGKDAEECIDHHIDQCLSACGLQTSVTSYKAEIPFDPRFINLSGSHTKIENVLDTVTNFTGARCLLLGSAGTGKSALVHHIADELEQELITIKPSDVLSKYVGEAEQNIAKLFKQASDNDAIIFLDEVDSVLTSRDIVSQQHERQLVNQILVELDRTEQTVFSATNYAKNLDGALLRRFDFKLNFEYLTTKQVLILYEENFGKCSSTIKNKLATLKSLTPGDFAIASRRNRMSKKPLSDSKNLEILTIENNRKIQSKAIGFVN
ncbi:AAA family ATPase [Thalassotalea sediminis]|uniref:AAA family ATPase n=1 Tax=Thalassotalea sediminis TaxID=1759089 RepID=UPI002572CBB3|nr:ATP-binding protein [Thalassotalea sediminis]